MAKAHDNRLSLGAAGAFVLGVAAYSLPSAALVSAPVRGVLGVQATVSARRSVALTFDDGPHPEGTPAMLEILGREGVKASFFLVGEQVALRPALAAEIVSAGHAVGLHCYRHRNLMRLGPRQVRDDFERAAETISSATGRQLCLYRPPYGILTTPAFILARRRGWDVVLWKVDGRDWAVGATPASIADRLLRRLEPSDVILLHDSDRYSAVGCWRRTAAALTRIIVELQMRGLRLSLLA
jgi:peptidoglycan-N-acetylglucosamine deacetylase